MDHEANLPFQLAHDLDRDGQASAFTKAADLIAAGDEEGGPKVVSEHTGGPGARERPPEDRKAVSRANARTMLGQRNEQRFARGHPSAVVAIPAPLFW